MDAGLWYKNRLFLNLKITKSELRHFVKNIANTNVDLKKMYKINEHIKYFC